MAISKRWAANGIKTPIPNDPQGDNLVNYDEGFTQPYRTPIKDGGEPIRLDVFNQLMFDITDEIIGIKSTINQVMQQFNGLIDDTQTSLTTTWSSQLISTKLSTAAAGAIIDDNTISTDKTWSSSKIKGMLDGKCAFSVGNWERQESSQNTTITNTTDKTKMVNLNVKVKTNAAANRYLGDVVVYYNTPSREVLRQSCVSQNIANTTDLTTAIGMTILGPQDSLIIQSTPANGVLDFWNNVTLIGNISSVLCSRPEPEPEPYDGLLFTAQEANSSIRLSCYEGEHLHLEYRTNTNVEWQIYTLGTTITLANIDDWVEMRNTGLQPNTGSGHQFVMTGKIAASGNIQYLLDKTGELLSVSSSCYSRLFFLCTSLTTAPSLPATTLAYGCYNGMFHLCTSLTTAPALPATTLAENCYNSMFEGCTSLTTAPSLPATTLAYGCYSSMFRGCTSLTTAPSLPATTLTDGCYYFMFSECTSLTIAPSLPATTLAYGCYNGMFIACSSLTTAPELPATTLANSCYYDMFAGCSKLKVNENGSGNKIFTCPSTSGLTNPVRNMFDGTGGSFTGTPTQGNSYYY